MKATDSVRYQEASGSTRGFRFSRGSAAVWGFAAKILNREVRQGRPQRTQRGARSAFSRRLFSGQFTRAILHFLDWLASRTLPSDKLAAHYRTGKRGEEAAYFHLRKLGYVMVARNFRSPRCRGEIDLIGWDGDVLCFVEVKTRTTLDVKPGQAAVDRYKRRMIAHVAREFLRRFPPSCQWRFDVVSVYYSQSRASQPQIEVFRNSSLTA